MSGYSVFADVWWSRKQVGRRSEDASCVWCRCEPQEHARDERAAIGRWIRQRAPGQTHHPIRRWPLLQQRLRPHRTAPGYCRQTITGVPFYKHQRTNFSEVFICRGTVPTVVVPMAYPVFSLYCAVSEGISTSTTLIWVQLNLWARQVQLIEISAFSAR